MGQVLTKGKIKKAEVSAVIRRADGTIEDLGVIATTTNISEVEAAQRGLIEAKEKLDGYIRNK